MATNGSRVIRGVQLTRLPERNLDVLRAVAVLCVLADHMGITWDVPAIMFFTEWDLGRIGVLLFFVHTSLVLMGSLEREGPREDWVSAFYIRRALRIYPLAIFTVVGVVLFSVPPHVTSRLVAATPIPVNAPTVLANGALIQNLTRQPDVLGVLWSLPLEVQMYLLLPAAFLLATRSVRSVMVGLGIAILTGLLVRFSGWPGTWRLTVLEFAPCFMGGVLAYALLRSGMRPVLYSWTWVPALLAAVPLFLMLRPTSESPERGWLFCLAVGCGIPLVGELRESMLTRAAHVICKYSYGIYLLHQPVLWFSFSRMGHQPLFAQWIACVALMWALPVLAYRLIENPGIRFGKTIVSHARRRSNARLTATVAYPLDS